MTLAVCITQLASDAGVSHTTARQWLSVLEAGFIVHLLPPWYANLGKRLVKAPKLYFVDVGLVGSSVAHEGHQT